MPLLSGIDTMKEVLKLNNKTKIIFTSADSYIGNQALQLGARAFLSKPFDIKDLLQTVNNVLNLCKEEQQII